MRVTLFVSGFLLALAGIALTATFSFTGPEVPQDPLGFVGWGLLLLGLAAMKVGTGLDQ